MASGRDPALPETSAPELADLRRLWRRLVRLFVAAARADEAPTLSALLAAHLGSDVGALPVVGELWPPYEHVNLQLGLEHWLATNGRRFELVGVTGFQHSMVSLADLAQARSVARGIGVGSVAMTNLASGPGGATHACVQCGLYLVEDDGGRLAILVRSGGPQPELVIEVLSSNPQSAAHTLRQIRELAFQHNVFRGRLLSFGGEVFTPFGRTNAPLRFNRRPQLDRAGLVLPPGMLEAIERHVLGVALHAEQLRASGQHLKRGLLLHGPPGTGKTHTVRYLLSRLPDTTAVLLSGNALNFLGAACSIARALQPCVVVVEDVDLIAEHRGLHPGQNPMLFQLLNEMDGLGDDADIAFVLTSNRADLLEPALAARPGRVDQAIEFRLPDAEGRRRLLELYRGGLRINEASLDHAVERSEGMTAAFLKELLRRAALNSASATDAPAHEPLTVADEHLDAALDELLAERGAMTRTLLGAKPGSDVADPQAWLRAGLEGPRFGTS